MRREKQDWNFEDDSMKKPVTRIDWPRQKVDPSDLELTEKLISLARVVKVVKGGKNLHFRALVVVGDGNGHVGIGLGKSKEVPEAIRKAGAVARKNMIKVTMRDSTIPHDVFAKFGAAKVLLRPALPGTGVIAGGGVRAVIEAVGIGDVLTKSLGSANSVNVVKATMLALECLRNPEDVVKARKEQIGIGEEADG
jgi:small subunit ribosomal protein S5